MKLNCNNICVPMDFSPSARNALRMAFRIADFNKANLYLVHITKPRYKTQFFNVRRKITAMIDRTAKSVLLEMDPNDLNKINNNKLPFTIIVQMGAVGSGIQEIVMLNKIDLVILGTSGKNNIFGTTHFSSSLEIIKHITCSFLTIPVVFNKQKIESVLYPFANNTKITDYLSFINPLIKIDDLWIHFLTVKDYSQIVELTNVSYQLDYAIDNLKLKITGIYGNVQDGLSISDKIKYLAVVLKVDVIVMSYSFVQLFNIMDHTIQNDKMSDNSSFPILCLNY
ncbi:universal stress protein [Flavobacterium sp. 102]|uniref:universal stress protein n=1 Tax=Flavobacterium sp. 102 TaxID=2135623 RepID=UPI000EB144AC|nr:universal stress protein [Flavobacterium sp. 102]RKS01655.1 nucleotide-binding universal stress UspA family protein [Flavobacterium sp. 102]